MVSSAQVLGVWLKITERVQIGDNCGPGDDGDGGTDEHHQAQDGLPDTVHHVSTSLIANHLCQPPGRCLVGPDVPCFDL